MALPTYDADLHHIKLGTYGFLVAGGANERLQATGRRSNFGSDDELIASPALSTWTVDDFLGGMFWSNFNPNDNAIHKESVGFVGSPYSRSLRTVPYLDRIVQYTTQSIDELPVGMFYVDGHIFTFWRGRTTGGARSFRVNKTNSLNTLNLSSAIAPAGTVALDRAQLGVPIVWLGAVSSNNILRYQLTQSGTLTAKTTYNQPAGQGEMTGAEFGSVVPVFAFGNAIYSGALSTTDATQPTWTSLGRIPGSWKGSAALAGLAYILVSDDKGYCAVFTCDGSNLRNLVVVPYAVKGDAIVAYGGRIFVTTRSEAGDRSQWAQLWEITGQSLRLVKSWEQEYWSQLDADDPYYGANIHFPWRCGSMAVHDGLLYLGGNGFPLLAYDLSTDGIYGGAFLDRDEALGVQPNPDFPRGTYLNPTFNIAGTGDGFSYQDLTGVTDYVVQSGDYLEYEIIWLTDKLDALPYIAVDLHNTTQGDNLRGSGAVDQNGLSAHPSTDISEHALGHTWYKRRIALPVSWVGDTIDRYLIGCEATDDDGGDRYSAYLRNIQITDTAGTTVRKVIWTDYATSGEPAFSSTGESNVSNSPWIRVNPGIVIDRMLSAGGRLYLLRTAPTEYGEGVWATVAGEDTDDHFCFYETVEFGPEPSLLKRWSEFRFVTRFQSDTIDVFSSIDSGDSYTQHSVTTEVTGDLTTTTVDLSALSASRTILLQLNVHRNTPTNRPMELLSHTLSFAFVDTAKRSWTFTIVGALEVEEEDGTTLTQDLDTLDTTLWGWIESGETLAFTDLDGQTYSVLLLDLRQMYPQIGPRVDGTHRERVFAVTLLEV